ncbi:MAG: glycoside hydrolase family 76 protein [Prevotella sp.]|jgi:predicted alpha-1,6-mannanase (GH76 family)|nr:glycoside hydrolase family 76 protein [Prevotella sp.]
MSDMKKGVFFVLLAIASIPIQLAAKENENLKKAKQTLMCIYKHYAVKGTALMRETYPFDESYKATYLASDDKVAPNPYAYLWPYSGTFSALNTLYRATGDKQYKKILAQKTLKGLVEYFDTRRTPPAYASYINSAPKSDRFYDDNIWLGIDFTEMYLQTGEQPYLEKAKLIWQFIESGMDNKLGGGIYWCEQKKGGKNTCSNAPGTVLALKLFEATKDSAYFRQAKALYDWTQQHLQDTADCLYYDNIRLNGRIGKAKFAYNSGQMLQASALLYKATQEDVYLQEAQRIAAACYAHFFEKPTGYEGKYRLLKKGNTWFTAVMFRGFAELYAIDRNPLYMDAFRENIDYAWRQLRNKDGLFADDWNAAAGKPTKWLLTQSAMVELYARMALIDKDAND